MEVLDNETKAKEIAENDELYGNDDSFIEECKVAAMAMAEWKDEQMKIYFNEVDDVLRLCRNFLLGITFLDDEKKIKEEDKSSLVKRIERLRKNTK